MEQIRENPYLQYFIGMLSYSNEVPFDASMLVHFRERISVELVNKVNQGMVKNMIASASSIGAEKKTEETEEEGNTLKNLGKLILAQSKVFSI